MSSKESLLSNVDQELSSIMSNLSQILTSCTVKEFHRLLFTSDYLTTLKIKSKSGSKNAIKPKNASYLDGLSIQTSTSNIMSSIESLLALTTELKQTLILNDFAALNSQMLVRHRTLANNTSKSSDALRNMQSDLEKVQNQIQKALFSTSF